MVAIDTIKQPAGAAPRSLATLLDEDPTMIVNDLLRSLLVAYACGATGTAAE